MRDLLVASTRDGTPVLGVCLGAQLLAAACGGRVETSAHGIEAGVVDVTWLPAAGDDPLVGGLPDPLAGPSMHLDAVVELPPGATWLGRTAHSPHQVFRVGRAAWGVQFHPEVSRATFEAWAALHEDDWPAWGLSGEQVVRDLDDRAGDVEAAGRALATRFAQLLPGRV